MTVAWVIGSRGLLGSAIVRALRRRSSWELLDAPPLSWTAGPEALERESRTTVTRLTERAAASDRGWAIIWAGGAGVTSSSDAVFEEEFAQFEAVLAGVDGAAGRGAFFYSSSAGGVYAGSSGPPFTEATAPIPISGYGRFKLRSEEAARQLAEREGLPVLIGRIANLYGPGQRLEKLQGLISHIARSRFTSHPTSIYVPLDTLRDYIYVDDCAALILDGLDRLSPADGTVTKVLASGQAATISELLGQFRLLTRGRPRVVLGTSQAAAFQALDLRLRSQVWPDLDRRRSTSLPAGIHATMLDMLATIQGGQASKADK